MAVSTLVKSTLHKGFCGRTDYRVVNSIWPPNETALFNKIWIAKVWLTNFKLFVPCVLSTYEMKNQQMSVFQFYSYINRSLHEICNLLYFIIL
jgi:hypothetical protein